MPSIDSQRGGWYSPTLGVEECTHLRKEQADVITRGWIEQSSERGVFKE